MTLAEIERPPATLGRFAAEAIALENAAVTRLLEHEAILDYSGHVSTRIAGKEALVIQVGSASRAEVTPESMLVVSFDGRVLAGDGQPPASCRSTSRFSKPGPMSNPCSTRTWRSPSPSP
jgi:hypothetical protein